MSKTPRNFKTVSTVKSQIPEHEVCQTALRLAADALPESILNHSLRVFFLARWLATRDPNKLERCEDAKVQHLLFIASIFHDMGASDLYNGKQRFEVEGADAAVSYLERYDSFTAEDRHQVWTAIAIHTSPGIAERINPLSRVLRLAVKADFSSDFASSLGLTETRAKIEKLLPRQSIEKELANAVVKQAEKIPEHIDSLTWPSTEKHPSASWPGILLRAHAENPDYDGINPAF